MIPSEGTVLITLSGPDTACVLVEDLNHPRDGKYTIDDLSDEEGSLFELLDPDGDVMVVYESREVLEGLLTHLHRHR